MFAEIKSLCFHSAGSKCNTADCFGCRTHPLKAGLLWFPAGMGNQPGNLQSYPGRCMPGIRLLKARCTQLQHALTGSGGEGWGFGRAGGDPRVKTPRCVSRVWAQSTGRMPNTLGSLPRCWHRDPPYDGSGICVSMGAAPPVG